jgi:hypothetical protein
LSVSIRADVSPVQKLVLAGLNNAFSGSDIRSLIDEIGLVPDDGELRIEIKGELAGILELCQEGTKREPGGLSTAGLAEQIRMVAGARNRLDLLLSAAIFATQAQPRAASSASNGPFTAVIIQR